MSPNRWTVRGSATALLSTHTHSDTHIHTRTHFQQSFVQVVGLIPDSQLYTDKKTVVCLCFPIDIIHQPSLTDLRSQSKATIIL